jgi:hypothetical protein
MEKWFDRSSRLEAPTLTLAGRAVFGSSPVSLWHVRRGTHQPMLTAAAFQHFRDEWDRRHASGHQTEEPGYGLV